MEKKLITIAGHEIDLALALPLKVRDWNALETLGVTPEILSDREKLTIRVSSIFTWKVLSKANNAVTQDMVDDLTIEELTEAMVKIGEVRTGINRPTSTTSTSSPQPTDGQGGILTN